MDAAAQNTVCPSNSNCKHRHHLKNLSGRGPGVNHNLQSPAPSKSVGLKGISRIRIGSCLTNAWAGGSF